VVSDIGKTAVYIGLPGSRLRCCWMVATFESALVLFLAMRYGGVQLVSPDVTAQIRASDDDRARLQRLSRELMLTPGEN